MRKKIKVGVFPNEFDGLFLNDLPSGCEVYYLVAKDSPEEKWVNNFLKKNVLLYNLKYQGKAFEAYTYPDIFCYSDLTKILKKNKIDFLFLTVNTEDINFLSKQSRKNGIKIIAPNFSLHRKLENKICFDKFLKKNNLPKPKSQICQPSRNQINLSGKLVLQKAADSMGGEGTFFLKNRNEIKKLISSKKINLKEDYLIRKFISGKAYGITVFIGKNTIAISAIRQQCYGRQINNQTQYLGIQWLPARSLKKIIKDRINKTFLNVGKALIKDKFSGLTNFDFIVRRDKIYILECNPRLTLATAQVFKFPQLISKTDFSSDLIIDFCFSENLDRKLEKDFKFYPLPPVNFSGSVMEIKVVPKSKKLPIIIKEEKANGLYCFNNHKIKFKTSDIRELSANRKELFFVSMAEVGQKFSKPDTIGQVVSSFPLFNASGSMNKDGRIIFEYFNVK